MSSLPRRAPRASSWLLLLPAAALVDAGAHAETLRFKVMSYNVAGAMCGHPMPGGGCLFGDPTPQMNKLAAMIQSLQIDVVGLQEVERGASRHGGKDMLALLLTELDRLQYHMDHRWVAVMSVDGGQHGQATLSRWPITDFVTRGLNPGGAYVDTVDMATIAVPSAQATEMIRVFNYHPGPATSCASTDPGYLAFIRGSGYLDGTSFLVGDFNLGRSASCYPRIVETHVDSCLAGGDPSCLCSVDLAIRTDLPPPCFAIDYVFHRFGAGAGSPYRWRLSEAHVDQAANSGTPISDHLPVVAEYARCIQDCVPGQGRCSADGAWLCVDSAGCGAWIGPTPCETRVDDWSANLCSGQNVVRQRTVHQSACDNGQCVVTPRVETETIQQCAACQDGGCVEPTENCAAQPERCDAGGDPPDADDGADTDLAVSDRASAGNDTSGSSGGDGGAARSRDPAAVRPQEATLGDGLACSSGTVAHPAALTVVYFVFAWRRRHRRTWQRAPTLSHPSDSPVTT